MIKNIVFDMGNVLLAYHPEEYMKQYIASAEDRELLLREVFGNVEWLGMDRGTVTEEEAIVLVKKRLPEHLHPMLPKLFNHWHEEMEIFPEIASLINQLKERQYNIYVLSNTNKKYWEFSEKITSKKHFAGEFISADCGLLKPDIDIYKAFFEQFSLLPETCFFVDDSPANIEACQHVGMKGFVYHRNIKDLIATLQEVGVKVELLL